jgi:hypothetical protein
MFVSGYLASKTMKVQFEGSYKQSDHASIYLKFHNDEETIMGPGLPWINARYRLNVAKDEINEMLAQK